jgi:hypothetical protein
MVHILEHSRGYYDCREVPCGTEYVWRPERFVLECDCGEKSILVGFLGDVRCLCGTHLTAFVRGKLGACTVEGGTPTIPGVLRAECGRALTGPADTMPGRS